ncbi:MAG: hypothetical protein B7X54_00445 [Idiomarina sp. 34-48-12]|nr:MAG: hypothetical protein B7X54_00445 [Idiomarina sp. 34-48-12]
MGEANKFVQWHGAAVEKALLVVAFLLLQKFNLLFVFYALGNHTHVECMRNSNKHFNQGFLLALVRHIVQEAAVNLNDIDRI